MSDRTFTCSLCGDLCEPPPDWSEDDARAEYERTHGKPLPPGDIPEGVSAVCGSCYTVALAWAQERGILLGGAGAN